MNRRISQSIVQELLSSPVSSSAQQKAIRSALEYNPENSDALYLMAVHTISAGDLTVGADFLKRALSGNDWALVYQQQARVLHADTLLKLKEYQSLVDLYASHDRWMSYLEEAEMLLIIAEGLYRNGDNAARLLARARSRYPRDPRFPALRIRYEKTAVISDYSWLTNEYYKFTNAESLWAVERYQSSAAVLFSAILYYLFSMEKGESRTELLELYFGGDKIDNLAHILAVEDLLYNERSAYLAGLDEADYLLALALGNEVVSTSGKQFFMDLVEKWPKLLLDVDRDGIDEMSISYDRSKLQMLKIDRNGDGLVEQEIYFESDRQGRILPQSVTLRGEAGTVNLVYDLYPYVDRVVLLHEQPDYEEKTTYLLRNMDYSYPVINFADPREEYSLRPLLPAFLQGRGSLADVLVYADLTDFSGFFLDASPSVNNLLDELSAYIYLIERRYHDTSSGKFEFQQSRFENQALLASRYDTDGDGTYDLLHFFTDDKIHYRIRLTDFEVLLLEYVVENEQITEKVLAREQFSQLPMKVQAAVFAEMWQVAE